MNNKLITFWTALYLLGLYVTIVGTFFLVWAIYDRSEFDFNIFYVTSIGFFCLLTVGKFFETKKDTKKVTKKFGFSK